MVSACDETLKALNEAVDAVTELKIFETVDFVDHPASRALAVAQNHIKECFNTFGVCLVSAARSTAP
jgi:hypothetical protein